MQFSLIFIDIFFYAMYFSIQIMKVANLVVMFLSELYRYAKYAW
jgi:hypothetical protein